MKQINIIIETDINYIIDNKNDYYFYNIVDNFFKIEWNKYYEFIKQILLSYSNISKYNVKIKFLLYYNSFFNFNDNTQNNIRNNTQTDIQTDIQNINIQNTDIQNNDIRNNGILINNNLLIKIFSLNKHFNYYLFSQRWDIPLYIFENVEFYIIYYSKSHYKNYGYDIFLNFLNFNDEILNIFKDNQKQKKEYSSSFTQGSVAENIEIKESIKNAENIENYYFYLFDVDVANLLNIIQDTFEKINYNSFFVFLLQQNKYIIYKKNRYILFFNDLSSILNLLEQERKNLEVNIKANKNNKIRWDYIKKFLNHIKFFYYFYDRGQQCFEINSYLKAILFHIFDKNKKIYYYSNKDCILFDKTKKNINKTFLYRAKEIIKEITSKDSIIFQKFQRIFFNILGVIIIIISIFYYFTFYY